MNRTLYLLLDAGVWFLTAIAYIFSADDVLSYFLIDGTSILTLITGVATFWFGARLNSDTRAFLRSKR